jgi:cysteine-rich repeat protein
VTEITLSGRRCGDGVVDTEDGEACDDGNTVTETRCPYGEEACTGCDANCITLLDLVGGLCGNGVKDVEEACDDGNTITETTCAYGAVHPVTGARGACQACDAGCLSQTELTGRFCGDGIVDAADNEVCDDGNSVTEDTATDSCPYGQLSCTRCDASCSAMLTGFPVRYCGDGNLDPEEGCDDGVVRDAGWIDPDNGCDVTCQVHSYVTCNDGVYHSGVEECDDNNDVAGDGCDSCVLEEYWTCQRKLLLEEPHLCVLARTPEACADTANVPEFTPCNLDTTDTDGNDRSHDLCIEGECRSPGCFLGDCNESGPNFPLSDTGQTTCWNDTDIITCPDMTSCDTTPFCGQDAQYGRDTQTGLPPRYEVTEAVNGEPVVLDTITGLAWQGCVAGLSGADCGAGTSTESDWWEALVYCDDLVWAGKHDWRLPNVYELQSILDYGSNPAIDVAVFHGTPSAVYWTSSSDLALWSSHASCIFFSMGNVTRRGKGTAYSIRCVRLGPASLAPSASRYTRISDTESVVTDHVTTRVWQGCPAGLTGDSCSTGSVSDMAWQAALSYCQSLVWGGHDDWYLPDVKEQFSLVDKRRHSPSIDTTAFPGTPSGGFWTSSPLHFTNLAWYISFTIGDVHSQDKGIAYHVRCARLGP